MVPPAMKAVSSVPAGSMSSVARVAQSPVAMAVKKPLKKKPLKKKIVKKVVKKVVKKPVKKPVKKVFKKAVPRRGATSTAIGGSRAVTGARIFAPAARLLS